MTRRNMAGAVALLPSGSGRAATGAPDRGGRVRACCMRCRFRDALRWAMR